MFDSILNRLQGKRVLVLGFGREGKSTLRFLQKYLPDDEIGVADKNAAAFAEFQNLQLDERSLSLSNQVNCTFIPATIICKTFTITTLSSKHRASH